MTASLSFASVEVLCPAGATFTGTDTLLSGQPFAPEVKDMIQAFSRKLAQDIRARRFPEIVALGHWLRPRMVEVLEADFLAALPAGTVALGRGMALHFAPGNVDTIFLYSAMLSILAGNATVVRVSSRPSPQIDLLVDILNGVLLDPAHASTAARIRIVRYERNADITAALSAQCDVRVMWGGDSSVLDLRAIPLPPRARDVPFPDRWSLSVIDAAALLTPDTDLPAVARAFANDAYWFGQMACSSPRLVLWRGNEQAAAAAANTFWPEVRRQSASFAPDLQPVQFMDKLVAQCNAAIDGIAPHIRETGSNVVSVSELRSLSLPASELMHIGGGLFWEARLDGLDRLAPLLDHRSQTICSFGITGSEWTDWTRRHAAQVDRIVPLGQALQFDAVWDGAELMRDFTRLVAIRC